MANGSFIALRMVLKGFGVNVDDLESKINQGAALVQEFDLNELRSAMQLVLDYKTIQEQNSKRMLAIMDHLGIPDPVVIIPPTHEEIE